MTMTQRTLDPSLATPRPLISALRRLALLGLCSAYLQGPLTKLVDFGGAVAEMEHFGLQPAPAFAVAVICFEVAASALVLSGIHRWAGALALAFFTLAATMVALRFWQMPMGVERQMATNAFFEHLGLAGAFVLVALDDLVRRLPDSPRQGASA